MDAPLPSFNIDDVAPPSKPTRTTIAQAEIARLKQEVAELRKELAARSEPPTNNPATLSESLLKDFNFLTDMARFSEGLEGLASEASIRKKYGFTQETWERLGADDKLVEAIGLEKAARIRSGAAKTEKAQMLVVAAPDILSGIMNSPTESAKHRVDAIKTLDSFTGGPAAAAEAERIYININLGEDYKLIFNKKITVDPHDSVETIDSTAQGVAAIEDKSDADSL
jgi:hypothetical protein